ncbi:MAG: cytochrome bc complex cytochrome b subunit [Anaerolineae bacterium]|jgi:quinol-cytochrome oxidoreductase complex cytochrome b subunit|nr:cytochrome bc complex cytochrome b subunit [Anaerolineae bacterium]
MSVLPFPSFLDDIKEKGLKKATFEAVDNIVERVTAGMNIQDIREALRGETPTRRPNPRLQPHADGFWLHMRPSFFHKDMTGLYPTFRLGWLSTYFVVFETITGMILMVWYTPSPQVAYGNMVNMLSNVPLGQLMRDLHRLGAEAMVLIVTLHMLRTFFTGSYKKPRQFTWFTGVILLFATLFLSFSGYLLPWDQLALWAVTIGASMIEATPPQIVGENLNLLVRGGPEMGANGLLRFYLMHVLLFPAILFIFTGVHYYKVIVHGHSLPPQKENIGEDTAKRVPLDKRVYFIPDVFTSEMMWVAVSTLVMIVLCIWFYHAPLESHADPQVTPIGTTAPWYFLWIQGALKLGDKVLWGVIFPGVFLAFVAIVPYIDTTKSRRYADRRFAMSVCFALISFTVVLSYMGLAEYGVAASADTKIIHEMVMEPAHNHMGKLLPIPYDRLVTGAYTTAQFDGDNPDSAAINFNTEIAENGQREQLAQRLNAYHLAANFQNLPFVAVPDNAPELLRALEFFHHELEENDQELYNAWGAVIVTQNQDGLKRLDVLISWDEVELTDTGAVVTGVDGEPVLVLDEEGNRIRRWSADHIFIHQNSAYFD